MCWWFSRESTVQAQGKPGAGFAAIPGTKGGQDMFGAYEIVKGWPKDISTVPGNEKWTYGAGQGDLRGKPEPHFHVIRGELPIFRGRKRNRCRSSAQAFNFRLAGCRGATRRFRRCLARAEPARIPMTARSCGAARMGVDAKWEDCIVVADAQGNIIERWTQWDKILKRAHYVYHQPIRSGKARVGCGRLTATRSTYSRMMASTLVQTIGTPTVKPARTGRISIVRRSLAWLPDSTMFVADGYNGTRVAKFDKRRKVPARLGHRRAPPETIRVRATSTRSTVWRSIRKTHRVYVNDRGNRRMQVFDENGKYLDQWPWARAVSSQLDLHCPESPTVGVRRGTSKVVRYDLDGHLLYAWGTLGDFPGGLCGMHGVSVDQEGNFYIAEVATDACRNSSRARVRIRSSWSASPFTRPGSKSQYNPSNYRKRAPLRALCLSVSECRGVLSKEIPLVFRSFLC